jgi:glucosamine--fructose-6-phosphate aminotransferase (isomerizing)
LGRPGHAGKEIIAGLQRLEYRGYDSAGICVVNHEKKVEVVKSVGKVANLKVKTDVYDLESYHVGIGHTRWATHGGVTEPNCHPHLSQTGRFIVIHNGIIENYREIKEELLQKGYTFYSETDTEIVAKMFEDMFTGNHMETLVALTKRIE